INEGGTPSHDAVEALARLYLAFGFGREAVNTLAIVPHDSNIRDVLHLLADVVDDRPADSRVLINQADCGGSVAFWHSLAFNTVAPLDDIGRTRVIMSFRLLPEALRRQLAPRLALLFTQ